MDIQIYVKEIINILISIVKLIIILIIIWGGATNWKFIHKNKDDFRVKNKLI